MTRVAWRAAVGWMLLLASTVPATGATPVFSVSQSASDGIYAAGQEVSWTIELPLPADAGDQQPELRFVIKRDGKTEVRAGVVRMVPSDKTGVVSASLTAKLDQPGTLLVELETVVGDQKIKGLAGAAFSPEKIGRSSDRPDDFDTFWADQVARLERIPLNPVVEAVDTGDTSIDYFKVRLDNINGTHVYGQLARPRQGSGKYPAIVVFQWAGVYGLDRGWVDWRARNGWLALNIMAHDLPFDREPAFYQQKERDGLAEYIAIGNKSRDESYFLRMYLGCHRAVEYLTTRDDWDGRIIVVTGASQGGLQSIVAAALHPKVTAVMAAVPAGGDTTAGSANRAEGWPYWNGLARGQNVEAVMNTSRYFDAVNFASRVTVPSLVAMGLVDTVCPSPGVFAIVNHLAGPVELIVVPHANHHGPFRVYDDRTGQWLDAIRAGRSPVERPRQ